MSKNKDNKLTPPKRERVSVSILGVDTSSPDITVKDGAMEQMHNMRYNDDAWRPVHMHDINTTIPTGVGSVVYHHPAAGDDVYVVSTDEVEYYSWNTKTEEKVLICSPDDYAKSISHFGNVLIFVQYNGETLYYIWDAGKYTKWEKPSAPIARLTMGEYTPALINFEIDGTLTNGSVSEVEEGDGDIRYGLWLLYDEAGNSIYPMHKDNKWWGEIAFFTAYRLKDGSVISPSPMGIATSEQAVTPFDDYRMQWRKIESGDETRYGIAQYSRTVVTHDAEDFVAPQMHYVAPSLDISIPTELSELVESVAVYATRIYSPFKFTTENSESVTFEDNKLPEQTFYLLEDVRVEDFAGGTYKVDLNYDALKNIEGNTRYTPLNNIHEVSPQVIMEYNQRLHIADVTTHLHPMSEIADYYAEQTEQGGYGAIAYAKLKIDNKEYVTDGVAADTGGSYYLSLDVGYNNLLTYNDYRCEEVFVALNNNQGWMTATYPMRPAPANNVAYHIVQNKVEILSGSTLHYPHTYLIYTTRPAYNALWEVNDVVTDNNKVMVSQTNNPFAFDFANTYSFGVGDESVLAMQSAAVEMSDAKFGEYPLFVFTTEGIYGLQSGAESVYSNVVPINYDVIVNPRTLAINYNVVYITRKGIHLLNAKGSTLISQPIDTMLGYPDVEKLQRLYPLRSNQYHEIVFADNGIAYIYSLLNGTWSTRDYPMLPISQDEAKGPNGEIFNIINENTALPARCSLLSRPIKLGNVELKRIETLITRLNEINKGMTTSIILEGSNNCEEWTILRQEDFTTDNILLRRTPSSHKYFRISIDMTDVEEFTLSMIDAEYYVKFLRRMR